MTCSSCGAAIDRPASVRGFPTEYLCEDCTDRDLSSAMTLRWPARPGVIERLKKDRTKRLGTEHGRRGHPKHFCVSCKRRLRADQDTCPCGTWRGVR